MARYKVSIWVSYGLSGSSQSWITDNVSPDNLVKKTNRLLRAYQKLYSADVKFDGCRIGVVPDNPNLPKSFRSKPFYPGTSNFPGTTEQLTIPTKGSASPSTSYPDNPKLSCQVAVTPLAGNVGHRYFSPIPDAMWANGVDVTRDGQPAWFHSALKEVLKCLFNGQGGDSWQLRTRADPVTVEMQQITTGLALQGGAGSNIGVQTGGDVTLDFPPNSKIQIKGSRPKQGTGAISLNGTYVVDAATFAGSTTTIFLRNTPNLTPANYKKLGTFQKVVYTYSPIIDLVAVRTTEHKRGVPFGAPVGRRQTRVSADP